MMTICMMKIWTAVLDEYLVFAQISRLAKKKTKMISISMLNMIMNTIIVGTNFRGLGKNGFRGIVKFVDCRLQKSENNSFNLTFS